MFWARRFRCGPENVGIKRSGLNFCSLPRALIFMASPFPAYFVFKLLLYHLLNFVCPWFQNLINILAFLESSFLHHLSLDSGFSGCAGPSPQCLLLTCSFPPLPAILGPWPLPCLQVEQRKDSRSTILNAKKITKGKTATKCSQLAWGFYHSLKYSHELTIRFSISKLAHSSSHTMQNHLQVHSSVIVLDNWKRMKIWKCRFKSTIKRSKGKAYLFWDTNTPTHRQ